MHKTQKVMWKASRVAHMMVQVNGTLWKGVIVRESDMMGMFPSRGSSCLFGTAQSSVASLMFCNLLDSISFVGLPVEKLDQTMCKLTLKRNAMY